MTAKHFFKALLPALCCLLLAACGFHLRGSTDLPFRSIYLGIDPYSDFAVAVKREIGYSGTTRIASQPDDADVRLQVIHDDKEKDILGLNSAGAVSAYQLRRYFSFRLVGRDGHEITPLSEITVIRDISFKDSLALAKEQEEKLIYAEMQEDVIQQLMRRLAATRMPAAK